jgi:hypothetical protein
MGKMGRHRYVIQFVKFYLLKKLNWTFKTKRDSMRTWERCGPFPCERQAKNRRIFRDIARYVWFRRSIQLTFSECQIDFLKDMKKWIDDISRCSFSEEKMFILRLAITHHNIFASNKVICGSYLKSWIDCWLSVELGNIKLDRMIRPLFTLMKSVQIKCLTSHWSVKWVRVKVQYGKRA